MFDVRHSSYYYSSTLYHTLLDSILHPIILYHHIYVSLQALHSMTVHFILFNTSHNLYSFCNKVPGGVADWVKERQG